MLGAEIEWVRELLRFGTGRATLRAFDEPASCLEDDKDGVTVWGSKDTDPNLRSNYDPNPSSNPNPTQVEVYTDLKTEVDTHKDIPTASTCARKIYLPVFREEHHFVQKLDSALLNFKAQQNQRGGAEFSYE